MHRRHVLHVFAGAAVPSAGCALVSREADRGTPAGTDPDTDDDHTATSTKTDDGPYPLGETGAVDGFGGVTVESAVVQRSVIHAHLWRDVYEPENAQMLVVEATVDADEAPDLSFSARLDEEHVDSDVRVPLSSDGTRYALSVPIRSVVEGAVVLEATGQPEWMLPHPTRERLAAAPEFYLHAASIRETDAGTGLNLTVENQGERDGTFRGIVVSKHHADADAAVRFPVPAGETITETVANSIVRNWDTGDDFEHDVTPDTRRFAVGYA